METFRGQTRTLPDLKDAVNAWRGTCEIPRQNIQTQSPQLVYKCCVSLANCKFHLEYHTDVTAQVF